MVIVIVNKEVNPDTGRLEEVVSHGVDTRTGRLVVMPQLSPTAVGAVFDLKVGEFVLREDRDD
jgi:hypothetical protein